MCLLSKQCNETRYEAPNNILMPMVKHLSISLSKNDTDTSSLYQKQRDAIIAMLFHCDVTGHGSYQTLSTSSRNRLFHMVTRIRNCACISSQNNVKKIMAML
jgi:hypothetical protein